MAQPPLSQQIRLLETELGVRLFERTTRRVSLTLAGEMFLAPAQRIVQAADSAERAMDEFQSGVGGLLRLTFVVSAAFEVMPRYLRSYRERWPQIQHDLQMMSSRNQRDALNAGLIDIGISRTPGLSEAIETLEFRIEPLFAAIGPDNYLQKLSQLSVHDLRGEALIGFDHRLSPTLHEQLQALFERAHLSYKPFIEATEYTTILGLVASDEGVAIVPDGVRTFQPAGVTYVPITDPGATMSMYLNWRAREPLRVVAQAREAIESLYLTPPP